MTISRGPRARADKFGVGLAPADECEPGKRCDGGDGAAGAATSPPPADTGGGSDAGLMRVIEREIIPRLFLAHVSAGLGLRRESSASVADDETAAFAEFVLVSDVAQIRTRLGSLRDRGVSLERIYLDLLAPAARHLRDLGARDHYDADLVTRGLARLRQVLGEIGRDPSDIAEATGKQGPRRMQ